MPKIERLDVARTDFLNLVELISEHNPHAAQRLQNDIEAKINALPDYPRLYRTGSVTGTREMPVRSNYIVVYEENLLKIKILPVRHAAQQWPKNQE